MSTNQHALPDLADPACPGPPHPSNSPARIGHDMQEWKRLVCSPRRRARTDIPDRSYLVKSG